MHLRGDEAVYWIIVGLVLMALGCTVLVFMPYKAFPVGNGWYWVSAGHHCLVLGGTESVKGSSD